MNRPEREPIRPADPSRSDGRSDRQIRPTLTFNGGGTARSRKELVSPDMRAASFAK